MENRMIVQVGATEQNRIVWVCVSVSARARPRPSGMENRMIPLAPQESQAQIYRLLPYRNLRYRADQLTDIQTKTCLSRIYTLKQHLT